MLAAAVLVAAVPAANAAPKGVEAKTAFDRGVAAYTKGDYQGASDALGASYAVEPDVETLFAWAQTERKLERCDKAIELYDKLLAADLPAANKAAIEVSRAECVEKLAAAKPVEPTPTPTPTPAPTPTPTLAPTPAPSERPPSTAPRAAWKDPVGLSLVGLGVAGLAVGGVFLVQAKAANSDKDTAPTYGEFLRLEDRAESRGKLGVIAAISGGVLVAGGIVWFVTRSPSTERAQVSAWITPEAGGVVAVGRF